jgi:hypothetical protein
MQEKSIGKEFNRQIHSCSRILALVSGAALLCLATGRAHADDCTVANVAGTYGSLAFGTNISGNPLGATPGPAATSGIVKFDGQGNFCYVASASFNGSIITNTPGQGAYSVNNDCTGTIVVGPDTANVVFVNDRNEVFGVHTTPKVVANLIFKRITTQPETPASLSCPFPSSDSDNK